MHGALLEQGIEETVVRLAWEYLSVVVREVAQRQARSVPMRVEEGRERVSEASRHAADVVVSRLFEAGQRGE